MKKMLLFVNPAAGREEMRGALMDAISRFTAAGYEVTCHPTQKPHDISEVIRDRGGQFDMIVACGGDGTLNETVTGLMHLNKKPKPLLGYIPTGTVNDFATSLHIPKTIPEAVENIISGVPFPVDMTTSISPMWRPSAPSPRSVIPRPTPASRLWAGRRIFWRGSVPWGISTPFM